MVTVLPALLVDGQAGGVEVVYWVWGRYMLDTAGVNLFVLFGHRRLC